MKPAYVSAYQIAAKILIINLWITNLHWAYKILSQVWINF